MPNRLTPLYSKIYYKEENYLEVKTAVFKYITPSVIKVEYIGISVYSVYHISNVPTFLCSELSSRATYITRPTPHPMVLLAPSVPPLAY